MNLRRYPGGCVVLGVAVEAVRGGVAVDAVALGVDGVVDAVTAGGVVDIVAPAGFGGVVACAVAVGGPARRALTRAASAVSVVIAVTIAL